ncbi:hypothetical protein NPIL_547931 [Nephila pilipes]|uniref:Uncharacterized protein n=1 Tax=Nephila pilipes TaxID=299642 RepID=A0A8X6U5S7_NEPPI|nr:hypothetical protein NPIL_547931 [Nephila pilipes]
MECFYYPAYERPMGKKRGRSLAGEEREVARVVVPFVRKAVERPQERTSTRILSGGTIPGKSPAGAIPRRTTRKDE